MFAGACGRIIFILALGVCHECDSSETAEHGNNLKGTHFLVERNEAHQTCEERSQVANSELDSDWHENGTEAESNQADQSNDTPQKKCSSELRLHEETLTHAKVVYRCDYQRNYVGKDYGIEWVHSFLVVCDF